MKRAAPTLLAGVVGAYGLATQPLVTSLLGAAGYVLGGALLATCGWWALFFLLTDVRGWRLMRPLPPEDPRVSDPPLPDFDAAN